MSPIVSYLSIKQGKKPNWALEWFLDGFYCGQLSRRFKNSSLKKIISRIHTARISPSGGGKSILWYFFLKSGFVLFVSGGYCKFSVSLLSFVGSLEEQWYLEIVDKGSVSCPTCQAVGRKTIEGLKKHMENCKQVRHFVALHNCCDFLHKP